MNEGGEILKISRLFNHFSTIKNKIFSVTLLLLFIFTVTGLTLFYYFSKMYEERIYAEAAETLLLSSTALDKELKAVEKLSFQISTDPFIQTYLKAIKEDHLDYQAYKARMLLSERLVSYTNMERYITSVQIQDYHRDHYVGGYDPSFEGHFANYVKEILHDRGANGWFSLQPNTLLSTRQIRRTENVALDHLGLLGITIDMDTLLKNVLNLPNSRSIVITMGDDFLFKDESFESAINDFNQIVNRQKRGYQITDIQGKGYFVTFQQSASSNLTYYNILPYDSIAEKTTVITHIMIIFIFFMIGLTIILSRRSAQAISKPIEELTEKMKQVQNGQFDHIFFETDYEQKDEIAEMRKNFSLMLTEINHLIKENYEKQLIIKETQYKALQSQMNPHFLYNTLDSINWLARVNKQDKISSLAEALGNMMRNIVSKKDSLITIEEEFDIVRNYITIQEYRYENRLNFTIKGLENIEQYSIPKLTIQPIVENAIQHGLEEMTSVCHIIIGCEMKEDELRIVVSDNGPGIDQATIAMIFEGKIKSKGSGIGLYNINERIKIMFGHEYGIRIESEEGKGTDVIVTLPFQKR